MFTDIVYSSLFINNCVKYPVFIIVYSLCSMSCKLSLKYKECKDINALNAIRCDVKGIAIKNRTVSSDGLGLGLGYCFFIKRALFLSSSKSDLF